MKRFIILTLLFLPSVTFAAATYELIAPISGVTSVTTLGDYLLLVFRVTIGIAGVLAVLMIVICGVKLIGSGSVSGRSEAKECIWNAIFGVLLVLGSWILLNTINPLLLNTDLQIGATASAPAGTVVAATTEAAPTTPGCYFKYKEVNTGNIKYSKSATCQTCEKILANFQIDPNINVQSKCYEIQSGVVAPPVPPAAPPPPATTGVQCALSGLNLCEPQFRQCTNSNCAQFAPMAAAHATGAVTADLLKALIIQESSCGLQLTGDGGTSCGPIQIKPATANKYLSACGVAQPVTCGWLSDKANWDKAVCLSAQYLKALTMTSCGTDIRNIAAGYNGGSGRCNPSANCTGDTSCNGTGVRQWECLYDDNAHTLCNQGLNTTRNYATRVLYCTQNPGY